MPIFLHGVMCVALLLMSGCLVGTATQPESVTLQERLGRSLVLRGINARVNGLFDVTFDDGRQELEPIPPFTAADCKRIASDFGWNLLRLPVNWSGIEPERGAYDQEYLDRILAVVDDCWQFGVYTLVDLHQDAYSKHIGEDGAPLWAIIPPPTELLEGPLHDLEERRISAQVLEAFESFYDNVDGLQDAYAAMAARVAMAIRDHPGVIGLEIQNEPVLLSDTGRLDEFHERVAAAVRAVAPDLPLHFEPNSLRNFSDKADVSGPFPFANSVYAPHIYTGVFQGDWETGDISRIADSVAAAVDEARQYDAALLVGEFGNDPRSDVGRAWLTTTFAELDRHNVSWALWVYEEWSQGSWGMYDAVTQPEPGRADLRTDVVELVARSWIQETDGSIDNILWNHESKTLDAQLADATYVTVAAPSVVYGDTVRISCGNRSTVVTVRNGRATAPCDQTQLTVAPTSTP